MSVFIVALRRVEPELSQNENILPVMLVSAFVLKPSVFICNDIVGEQEFSLGYI